ncbi:MAG: glycosyltransferase family 2 protein [Paraglaciecola sp.]|uniref:glycosyltransferase family 2 protein n=1 Tax=Paraglaciecola sp. TaxID=1920173 RepID=UPI00273D9A1D|nr:glycosyltransferase family A protein [Paraglaciecola sp.]MDP5030509.1 glycosyltransferase family 2 protein [Paraglaciecola sp.]MDP5131423.1 glycosyltransferase family 2 protein [Paraglaciecola sp.]
MSVSVVTTCKNRTDYLLETLNSFLSQPIVSEVVVVDFDSTEPVYNKLSDFLSNSKLKVLRVDNQPVWKIGLAQNIGINFAKADYILKIDSDVGIFDLKPSLELISAGNCFVRGRSQLGVSSGLVLFDKASHISTGGYNDWITGWGYDDGDFYRRLYAKGLTSFNFSKDDFFEIKQSFISKNVNVKTLNSVVFSDDSGLASKPKFTALRNFIFCNIFEKKTGSKPLFKYIETSPQLFSVEIINDPDLDKQAKNYIEIANCLAFSFYSQGFDADDINSTPKLFELIEMIKKN